MTGAALPAARARAADPDTLKIGDQVWHDSLGGPYEVVRARGVMLRRAGSRRRRGQASAFPVSATELREHFTTSPSDRAGEPAVVSDAVARRVAVWHAVAGASDELATVRAANGTSPADRGDWLAVLERRITDLARPDGDIDVDQLIGLAADAQALLEHIAAEDAR